MSVMKSYSIRRKCKITSNKEFTRDCATCGCCNANDGKQKKESTNHG